MVSWSENNSWVKSQAMKKRRKAMITQMNAFLEWSLSNGHELPEIPKRRVDEGGLGSMFKSAKGQKLIAQWWGEVFDAKWPL